MGGGRGAGEGALQSSFYWTLLTLSADHYTTARHNTRIKCSIWSNRSRRKHKTFACTGCPLPFIKLVKWQGIASQLYRPQTLLCVICLHWDTTASGNVKRDTTPASLTNQCILFASIAPCLSGSCKNSYRCWFKLQLIPSDTVVLENLIFLELIKTFPSIRYCVPKGPLVAYHKPDYYISRFGIQDPFGHWRLIDAFFPEWNFNEILLISWNFFWDLSMKNTSSRGSILCLWNNFLPRSDIFILWIPFVHNTSYSKITLQCT